MRSRRCWCAWLTTPTTIVTATGLARLAWKLGYDERYVQRLRGHLIDAGLLVPVQRGGGRGHSNHYRIDLKAGTLKPPFQRVAPAPEFDIVEWPNLIFGNGPPVVHARPTLPTSDGRSEVRCAGEE